MRPVRSMLFALVAVFALSVSALAQVNVSITIAPPALPVYDQPLCPGDGYLWTPGYWAYDYDDGDYYWVPGTWVMAPEVGFLWTPPYWGWEGGFFRFHEGYWGPHVGFYGGVYYGFGYGGIGFEGGRWEGGHFFYNRTVANINVVNIHNVYNTTIINRTTINRVSYNGGNGGITARPTPEEEAAARDRHVPPVAAQTQHIQTARENPELRASRNQGKPAIAATARPGDFGGEGHVAAREAGAPYHAPAKVAGGEAGARAGGTGAVHAHDLQAGRPAAPNTGNPKLDKKYQQQQDKLMAKQEQERNKLQAQQDKEHKAVSGRDANDLRNQQLEQKHTQQTQALQQRHEAEMQRLQTRQTPRPARPK